MAALADQDRLSWVFPGRIYLAQSYSALGDSKAAAGVLAAARSCSGPAVEVFRHMLEIAQAWQYASEGMVSAASTHARTTATAAAASGQFAIEAEAPLHAVARFGTPDEEVPVRLAELAAQIDGDLVGLYARHARAVVESDAGALDGAPPSSSGSVRCCRRPIRLPRRPPSTTVWVSGPRWRPRPRQPPGCRRSVVACTPRPWWSRPTRCR